MVKGLVTEGAAGASVNGMGFMFSLRFYLRYPWLLTAGCRPRASEKARKEPDLSPYCPNIKQNGPPYFEGPFVGDRPDGFRYRDISSNISTLTMPHNTALDKGLEKI